MDVDVAGERVWLDADRALVWRNVLIVADTHFGKDASARAQTIPIPPGTTNADLARLDALIARRAIRALWFLGDVFDSAEAGQPATSEALTRWRARHRDVEIHMVAGNHDRRALPLADAIGFRRHPDFAPLGPWRLAHHPGEHDHGYVLCGHVHPGLRIRGPARDNLRLPAFIIGSRRAILPSFGGLTGSSAFRLSNDESAFLCANNRTIGPVRSSKK